MKIFKKRITRLIISIVSYLFLLGTYLIYPTFEMGNNIFKNIIMLLIAQPVLITILVVFTIGLLVFFVTMFACGVYEAIKWISEGEK